MDSHAISKALEVWGLQSLVTFSILMGLLATTLVLLQSYWRELESHLTLRVSVEFWRVGTRLLADALLAATVLAGYAVLNPDILADIKVAVPFHPLGTVCFAVALVLRVAKGGHAPAAPAFRSALRLMAAGAALQALGFTFVAEAPSGEYLASHPSPFWVWVKTHLRSNADPVGLEVSQVTFYLCFAALVAIGIWGFRLALARIPSAEGRG